MAHSLRAARTGPFMVFRNRNFALLWTAQFITNIGTGLTTLASSILVYRETGTALSVGLVMLAVALPSLFVGLIAGVFVDRLDRKRIMVACEVIRAALVLAIPLLLSYGIGWLYVLVFLSSVAAQFHAPAEASVLPELAPDEELAAANAMMSVSGIGALTVGFAAAGLLASEASINLAFVVDGVTFLVSALIISNVRIPPMLAQVESSVRSVVTQLQAGIEVVRGTPPLRSLFVFYTAVFFTFGMWNALILPFVVDVLGGSEFQYSLFEGFYTIGFVAGSLVMASLANRLHEGQWVIGSILVLGLFSAGVALAQSIPVALALFIVSGVVNAPSYVARGLIIQRNTTRDVRGRVNSAFLVSRDLVMMVGMALAGLADLVSVRALQFTLALAMVGWGCVALRFPGLGQPTAEWRRALAMLRAAPTAPGLGLGRAAQLADIDVLAVRLPALAGLSQAARQDLAMHARVHEEAPAGTVIVRSGDTGDATWFLIDGRTYAASHTDDGAERILEVHSAGDFFGEIAAMTGMPRTATVVAEQPTTLIEIPANTLRHLLTDPALNRLFLSKMTERLARMGMIELPRFPALDQESLRDLRTPAPGAAGPAVAEQPAPGIA